LTNLEPLLSAGRRGEVGSIQVLRACAAIAVSLVHFEDLFIVLPVRRDAPNLLGPLAGGVDLFFVISGFIMVYASEPLFGYARSPLIFLCRRLLRIWPIYVVTTMLYLFANGVWFINGASVPAIDLIRSFLFIPFTPAPGNGSPVYGVGWTLNYEMLFYVIFAPMTVLSWRSAAVASVSAILALLVLAGPWGYDLLGTSAKTRIWTNPIVIEFVYGMAIALVYRTRIRLPGMLCLAAIVTAAVTMWTLGAGNPPGVRYLGWGLPAAVMVAGAVLAKREIHFPKILLALGDASYSIYLIHSIMISAIIRAYATGNMNTHLPIWPIATAGFVMTLLLSLVSFYWFERRVSQLSRYIKLSPRPADGSMSRSVTSGQIP
jgi:peptidoglycan/LPS O-acetylase OafA/YrhL